MKRIWAILLVCCLAAGLLAGCGGAGKKEENPLTAAFRGVYEVRELNGVNGEEEAGGGYFYPVRFSAERLAEYKKQKRMPYAPDSVNIRLSFTTDAEEIGFSYGFSEVHCEGSAEYGSAIDTFDIYEDGKLADTVTVSGKKSGELTYQKQGGADAVITVYFPVFRATVISNVSLGNFKPAPEKQKKVLVLGDSISQGLFADAASAGWVPRLCMALDAEFLNLSVGGETFRAEALDEDVHFDPDLIFVSLGTNDIAVGHSISNITEDMEEYFPRLREIYGDTPIVFVSPCTSLNKDFEAKILEKAAQYCDKVFDGTTLCDKGAATHFTATDVHPNASGHSRMAERLLPEIQALLK